MESLNELNKNASLSNKGLRAENLAGDLPDPQSLNPEGDDEENSSSLKQCVVQ